MTTSEVTNSQRKIFLCIDSAQKVIEHLTHSRRCPPMSLHFVGKRKISKLHAQFFGDPSPTDCITLPFHDPLFLGEVFVCPQVAAEYADLHEGILDREITLYVVHGFLHLIGYDDLSDADAKAMREQEKVLMKELAENNLGIRIKT